jgi:hypothetical protein
LPHSAQCVRLAAVPHMRQSSCAQFMSSIICEVGYNYNPNIA